MAIEFELKFKAQPEIIRAIDRDIQGETQNFVMETTYFDGMNGELTAKKYTLRRRMENGISVCTLKIPKGDNCRGEWEIPCEDIQTAIPLLCEMGAPAELAALTAQGVREVCGAKFNRIAKTLVFDEGTLELALDLGVLTGGGKQIPLCEIEVELKSGREAFAEHYAKCLAQKYGLVPEPASKFRRALALSKGEL